MPVMLVKTTAYSALFLAILLVCTIASCGGPAPVTP